MILKIFIFSAVGPFFLDDHPVSPYIKQMKSELPQCGGGVGGGRRLGTASSPNASLEPRAQQAQGGSLRLSLNSGAGICAVTWPGRPGQLVTSPPLCGRLKLQPSPLQPSALSSRSGTGWGRLAHSSPSHPGTRGRQPRPGGGRRI